MADTTVPTLQAPPTPRRAVLGAVAASIAGIGLGPGAPPNTFAAVAVNAAEASDTTVAVTEQEGAILITGANSGVGFSAAKQIAAQGKRVVLACRTEAKGAVAAAAIREKVPDAKLDVLPGVGLEMTDLRSTSDYIKAFQDSGIPLDVLVLNAGIMAVPLGRTEQGHELHFGVNHLAHFLVQDGLTPQLRATRERTGERGRLVACSSIANTLGDLTLDLTDLDWRRRKYNEWEAYCASKAANVLLTDEVARREPDIASNSFHPGIVTTNLIRYILPELTAENRDPEAEKETKNGKLLAKMGIRDADEVRTFFAKIERRPLFDKMGGEGTKFDGGCIRCNFSPRMHCLFVVVVTVIHSTDICVRYNDGDVSYPILPFLPRVDPSMQGAKTHVWLSTAEEAGEVTGRFFIDPGVEYPSKSVTREQLLDGGDWFLVTGREPLAPQLRLPDVLYDWRTEANAKDLWEQSMEMTQPFRV